VRDSFGVGKFDIDVLINRKDTKKRLSIRFVEGVEDKFLDLGGKLADDNGLSFADGYSIVPDGDLDISGL
jgi:hypothetical protein